MKRFFSFLLLISLLTLCLVGCAKYTSRNFLGKTSAQIQEQYGAFDLSGEAFVSTDSSYFGFGYGYLIKDSRVGFLGTTPAEYFFVVFDENGIAVACYEGYWCNGG